MANYQVKIIDAQFNIRLTALLSQKSQSHFTSESFREAFSASDRCVDVVSDKL